VQGFRGGGDQRGRKKAEVKGGAQVTPVPSPLICTTPAPPVVLELAVHSQGAGSRQPRRRQAKVKEASENEAMAPLFTLGGAAG
jgi:hypothetical protein